LRGLPRFVCGSSGKLRRGKIRKIREDTGKIRGRYGEDTEDTGTGYETPKLHESYGSPNPPLLSMARIARVVVPGCWHHITQRGNRRQAVFFEDTDRALYLQLLAHHTRRCSVRIVGYCLMGNHVHLIPTPPAETAFAKSLGRAHMGYTRWQNLRRGETGHVWQNRFFPAPWTIGTSGRP
jgi:REP element-mobilizing transposase RayT